MNLHHLLKLAPFNSTTLPCHSYWTNNVDVCYQVDVANWLLPGGQQGKRKLDVPRCKHGHWTLLTFFTISALLQHMYYYGHWQNMGKYSRYYLNCHGIDPFWPLNQGLFCHDQVSLGNILDFFNLWRNLPMFLDTMEPRTENKNSSLEKLFW